MARPRGVPKSVVGGQHYSAALLQMSNGTWHTFSRTVALFCMTQVIPGAYVELAANKTTGPRIPTYEYVQADTKLKTTIKDQYWTRKGEHSYGTVPRI